MRTRLCVLNIAVQVGVDDEVLARCHCLEVDEKGINSM